MLEQPNLSPVGLLRSIGHRMICRLGFGRGRQSPTTEQAKFRSRILLRSTTYFLVFRPVGANTTLGDHIPPFWMNKQVFSRYIAMYESLDEKTASLELHVVSTQPSLSSALCSTSLGSTTASPSLLAPSLLKSPHHPRTPATLQTELHSSGTLPS